MNSEYSTMVAGSFLKVGAGKQFTLGDITVAYGDEYSMYPRGPHWNGEDEWEDCCDGSIRLTVLTSTGGDGGTYAWMDTVTDAGDPDAERIGPGWAHYTSEGIGEMLTPEELRSAACTFNIGQAFWIEGGGARLQSAGAVTDQDIEFETEHEYSTAVGNGTAADWTLGEVSFLYGDEYSMYPRGPHWNGDDEWEDCCDGSLRITRLTSTGGDGGTYAWMDTVTDAGDPDAERIGPGWAFYTSEGIGDMLTPGELAAVKVNAGDGFWVEGGGAKLRFINAITPTKDAE